MKHSPSHPERAWWTACALFLLAFVVRWQNLPLIEHNVDHAYYVGQALRTLDRGEWPIIGQPTSLQIPNSAFLGYLYVPVLAFTRSVIGAYLLVIALNSAAAALLYRLGRARLPDRAAIVAACAYALNPWMIEYSSSTWSYSIMPFLLCLLALSLWKVLHSPEPRQSRAAFVAVGAMTGVTLVTLTGYFIVATMLVLAFAWRRRLPWRCVAAALPVFIVPTMIFALALLIHWPQTTQQASALLEAGRAASLRTEPLLHTARLVTGADYELLRGRSAPAQDSDLRHGLSVVLQLGMACLLAGGVVAAAVRVRRDAFAQLLLAFAVTPVALMSYNSALIHPFYLMVTIPAGYLLLGWGVGHLPRGRVLQPTLIGLLVCWGGVMLLNSQRYYEETAAVPGAHGLSALPLGDLLPLAAAARAAVGQGTAYVPVEPWILHSAAGQVFDADAASDPQARLFVPPGGLVMARMAQAQVGADLLDTSTIWQRRLADNRVLELVRVSGTLPDNVVRTVDVASAGDVRLVGYRVVDGDEATAVDVYWWVEQMPADLAPLYSLAVHVYRDGERVALADGRPVMTYRWRPGTLIAQRAPLPPLPPGEYVLRAGLYDGSRGLHAVIAGQSAHDGMVALPGVWRHDQRPGR